MGSTRTAGLPFGFAFDFADFAVLAHVARWTVRGTIGVRLCVDPQSRRHAVIEMKGRVFLCVQRYS
jgi:hypothetical protein